MDFGFSEEQEQLRSTVRRMCAAVDVRAADGYDRPLWSQLTGQLGATGLAIAEEHGGAGATLVEVGVVLEEAGRYLLPVPYLSTVTAIAALGSAAPELLPALASGESVATLAVAPVAYRSGALDGVAEHVLDGHLADVVLVATPSALYLASGGSATVHPTLDQTRRQARLEFPGVPAREIGDGAAAARAVDLVRAGLAVESVGVARAALELTVGYLRTREQFGVPLATFQALRHRVADLAVAVEAATSTAWYAWRLAAAGDPEFTVAAPLAKAYATEVAYRVTAETIQLHGGIGFTWEHHAHLYFKRATANRLLLGTPTTLRREIATRTTI
jgi:alkylation response protein AidB-like acyl-CoA dehydrogenase